MLNREPLRSLAHEPFVHFLLAGALLLIVAIVAPSSKTQENGARVHITANQVQQLRDTWAAQRGKAPGRDELNRMVDGLVREQLFYREAVRSGLDRNDAIIRRHLAQKMEFLARGEVSAMPPSSKELQEFFARNRDRYATPARIAFAHVYFNDTRQGGAVQAADAALRRIRSERLTVAAALGLGDAFMLRNEYPLQTREEVRDLFGGELATRLFTLPVGEWAGPISSTYGVHVVRVERLVPPRVPDLEDIRGQVEFDFNDDRMRRASDSFYRDLRQKVRVDVDGLEERGR
jgi:hypothetical protein